MLLKCWLLSVISFFKMQKTQFPLCTWRFCLIVLNTNILQNVADTHPVVEIRLLPYALQPVYMSLTVSAAKGKQGQRGYPCLCYCSYAKLGVELSCTRSLDQVDMSALKQTNSTRHVGFYKPYTVHFVIDCVCCPHQGWQWLDLLFTIQQSKQCHCSLRLED